MQCMGSDCCSTVKRPRKPEGEVHVHTVSPPPLNSPNLSHRYDVSVIKDDCSGAETTSSVGKAINSFSWAS